MKEAVGFGRLFLAPSQKRLLGAVDPFNKVVFISPPLQKEKKDLKAGTLKDWTLGSVFLKSRREAT